MSAKFSKKFKLFTRFQRTLFLQWYILAAVVYFGSTPYPRCGHFASKLQSWPQRLLALKGRSGSPRCKNSAWEDEESWDCDVQHGAIKVGLFPAHSAWNVWHLRMSC